jgi:hypothetical protein
MSATIKIVKKVNPQPLEEAISLQNIAGGISKLLGSLKKKPEVGSQMNRILNASESAVRKQLAQITKNYTISQQDQNKIMMIVNIILNNLDKFDMVKRAEQDLEDTIDNLSMTLASDPNRSVVDSVRVVVINQLKQAIANEIKKSTAQFQKLAGVPVTAMDTSATQPAAKPAPAATTGGTPKATYANIDYEQKINIAKLALQAVRRQSSDKLFGQKGEANQTRALLQRLEAEYNANPTNNYTNLINQIIYNEIGGPIATPSAAAGAGASSKPTATPAAPPTAPAATPAASTAAPNPAPAPVAAPAAVAPIETFIKKFEQFEFTDAQKQAIRDLDKKFKRMTAVVTEARKKASPKTVPQQEEFADVELTAEMIKKEVADIVRKTFDSDGRIYKAFLNYFTQTYIKPVTPAPTSTTATQTIAKKPAPKNRYQAIKGAFSNLQNIQGLSPEAQQITKQINDLVSQEIKKLKISTNTPLQLLEAQQSAETNLILSNKIINLIFRSNIDTKEKILLMQKSLEVVKSITSKNINKDQFEKRMVRNQAKLQTPTAAAATQQQPVPADTIKQPVISLPDETEVTKIPQDLEAERSAQRKASQAAVTDRGIVAPDSSTEKTQSGTPVFKGTTGIGPYVGDAGAFTEPAIFLPPGGDSKTPVAPIKPRPVPPRPPPFVPPKTPEEKTKDFNKTQLTTQLGGEIWKWFSPEGEQDLAQERNAILLDTSLDEKEKEKKYKEYEEKVRKKTDNYVKLKQDIANFFNKLEGQEGTIIISEAQKKEYKLELSKILEKYGFEDKQRFYAALDAILKRKKSFANLDIKLAGDAKLVHDTEGSGAPMQAQSTYAADPSQAATTSASLAEVFKRFVKEENNINKNQLYRFKDGKFVKYNRG